MTAAPAIDDQRRLICAWADNAVQQLPLVTDIAAWVVLHRYRLHDLEQLAPGRRAELQLAINARWELV